MRLQFRFIFGNLQNATKECEEITVSGSNHKFLKTQLFICMRWVPVLVHLT